MPTTIRGTYRNGRIELSEDPGVVGDTAVVVTFLESIAASTPADKTRIMTFGMLADPARRMSGLEDFKSAEYDDSRWDRD